MPRYFFHIVDGDEIIEDCEGTELPDLEAAVLDALHSARHLLADRIRRGELANGQRFEVRDEAGELVAIVPFQDAIRLS